MAREKMSASLLSAPPFETSGADHRVPPTRCVVLPDESEGVMAGSSGIIVSRRESVKQARWSFLIRICDLGPGQLCAGNNCGVQTRTPLRSP